MGWPARSRGALIKSVEMSCGDPSIVYTIPLCPPVFDRVAAE